MTLLYLLFVLIAYLFGALPAVIDGVNHALGTDATGAGMFWGGLVIALIIEGAFSSSDS